MLRKTSGFCVAVLFLASLLVTAWAGEAKEKGTDKGTDTTKSASADKTKGDDTTKSTSAEKSKGGDTTKSGSTDKSKGGDTTKSGSTDKSKGGDTTKSKPDQSGKGGPGDKPGMDKPGPTGFAFPVGFKLVVAPPLPPQVIRWGLANGWPPEGWGLGLGPYRIATFIYKGQTLDYAVRQLSLHAGLPILWSADVVAKGFQLSVVQENYVMVPVHYALTETLKPYGLYVVWSGTAMVIVPIPPPVVVVPVAPPPPPPAPLDKVGTFDFRLLTLEQAAAQLSAYSGVPVVFAATAVPWQPQPATLYLPNTSVRVALTQMLLPYNLVWQEEPGKVTISAPVVVLPPPRPLVLPVRPGPGPARPRR